MSGDVTPYVSLVTSEHRGQPKFIASVTAAVQPFADLIAVELDMPTLFDLDVAVGAQLDVLGQWIGVTRFLTTPIVGVFFSFDTAGLGFDQGLWIGPYDPITGLARLDDDHYRTLLRARILNNHWDGSIPNAYAIWAVVFSGTGNQILIEDHGDLTMDVGLVSTTGLPDAVTLALFNSGDLSVKPAGVRIQNFFSQSQAGPIFAFDLQNSYFDGFDVGAWATLSPGM